jgi:excisionase family DNA binding protein
MSRQKQKHEQNHNPELLTVREVSDILRVDGTTIRRWVKNGALEAVTLPHLNKRMAYRIKRETVHNLLNQHTA